MELGASLSTGCLHYKRHCSILSPCCKKIYNCQVCHDTEENHRLENGSIKKIVCNNCKTKQNISNKCISCNLIFGMYFCRKCVLWSNINSDIFHCAKCGFCRVGVESEYSHCNICNACIAIDPYEMHKHLENTLKSDCPICAEYLFTSRKDIILMKCGHSIHLECYTLYSERNNQCPICMKLTICKEQFDKQLDRIIESVTEVDKKRSLWTCDIMCYECSRTSRISYKYLFNKCGECNSYNTRLLHINKSIDDYNVVDTEK